MHDREVKAIIVDTANWSKAQSIITFLDELVKLQGFVGTDFGDALPFFYTKMIILQKKWNSQPFSDRAKGFGGVSHAFAIRANKILYEKWEKFEHPLHGTACLLHPINITPRPEGMNSDYPYSLEDVPVGTVPAETFMKSLEDDFESFINRYVKEEDDRVALRDELTEYQKRERSKEFNDEVMQLNRMPTSASHHPFVAPRRLGKVRLTGTRFSLRNGGLSTARTPQF